MTRKIVIAMVLVVLVTAVVPFVLGGVLVEPRQQSISKPSTPLKLETVSIPTDRGYLIAGWFVQGEAKKPGILLLHSLRSNRLEMLGRAEFLNRAGYSVLLIDMQAHGETPGEQITFGYRESLDAHTALRYLRGRLDGGSVGVIGMSLGGAAALLGDSPIKADAVILEAVYSTIDKAIQNRLAIRFGALGRGLSLLLEWQIEPRLGVGAVSLAPLSAVGNVTSPVLIVAGEDDRHTLVEESKQLFEAAPQPKELWLIEGARHQNLHRFSPAAYERRVLAFFGRHIKGGS